VAFFLDLGRLALPVAEIIKLCPADTAIAEHFDLVHPRRVDREYTLDADAIGDLPDTERLSDPAASPTYDESLKHLDSLFVSLKNLHVHPDSVAGSKIRDIFPHPLTFYAINNIQDIAPFAFDPAALAAIYLSPKRRSKIIAAAALTDK
jgi:hypothetical protein